MQAIHDWDEEHPRKTGSFRLAAGHAVPDEDEMQADTVPDGLLMLLKAAATCDASPQR